MIPYFQKDAALAAYILAVDPRVGGLLLKGALGSGKTLLMNEFAKWIRSVRIPLGSEVEALTGSINIQALLSKGEVLRKTGLLDGDDQAVLLVEHLDLFNDDIQDLILSCGKPVMATVSGSEEIRGRLLDRFGLCVEMSSLKEPDQRLSVLSCHFYGGEDEIPGTLLAEAFNRLDQIRIPGWYTRACAFTCSALRIAGHRAEVALFRSGIALASLQGTSSVEKKHLETVAPMVLGHRSARESGGFPEVAEVLKAVNFACEMAMRGEKEIVSNRMKELTERILDQVQNSIHNTPSTTQVRGLDYVEPEVGALGRLSQQMRNKFFREVKMFSSGRNSSGAGSGSESNRMQEDNDSGRPVKPVKAETIREMNPLLSVKAAAMDGKRLPIVPLEKHYWRKWKTASKTRAVCMLAVDGSRSSQEYMGDLGYILDGLFNKVFHRSSRVGLAVIRNGKAVMHFAPTRNRLRVFGRLNDLTPGGATPLDELLSLSGSELRRSSRSEAEQRFIILLSDCFPEPVPVGDVWNSDIYGRVRKQAVNLGRQGIPVLVIDPMQISRQSADDSPGRRLGRFIAHKTGGKHVTFAKESQYDIFGALKESALKPRFVSLNSGEGTLRSSQFAESNSLAHLLQHLGSV
ncbi:hypothetical protein CSA37_00600 [Candidatus Fermentibacteria bacterium]|nr:MAG: hypothetical protein CSA37_09830 [Candidatus Fermentibacteria bacterium]PIE53698.1 MAG: hypothetical protein CSA37_00600 [Candidatus Fermentibacteria bacterium]